MKVINRKYVVNGWIIMGKERPKRIRQQTIMQEYHLTKGMIEKYFPEPIRRKNLDHPGGYDREQPTTCLR